MEKLVYNREKESLDGQKLIADLMDQKLPEYADCPEYLDLNRHKLASILTNVRKEANADMTAMIKNARNSPEMTLLPLLERRTATDNLWWTEYYQSIYNNKGRWYANEVRRGGESSSSVHTKKYSEPHMSLKRIYIHTHPADNTFSGPDLYQFFLAIDPQKIMDYEQQITFAGLTVQFVVTDNHVYMCFPTKETYVPDFAQATCDGLIPAGMVSDVYPEEFEKLWKLLKEEFGEERLWPFMGNKLYGSPTVFPDEVNDYGASLINLAHTFGICQKYKLQIYVADRGNYLFRKINNIETVFPELL